MTAYSLIHLECDNTSCGALYHSTTDSEDQARHWARINDWRHDAAKDKDFCPMCVSEGY